jgi:iron complex outermembrane receptor protein
MAYATASRGFKSGGFNITAPVAGRGYAPEFAWSYEVGLKTVAARTRMSMAAFHTDYQNLQVQTPLRDGVIDISNAAAATIRGVELEMTTDLPPVRFGGHVAWLDARYDEYIAVGVGGVIGDVAGRRLTNAPEWSGRLWTEWNVPLAWSMALSSRIESTWQSVAFFTPFNDQIQRQSPYGLLDASVELRPRRGAWGIGAYGRNLTNETYITATFGTPPTAFGGRPGPPRQFGLQFSLGR